MRLFQIGVLLLGALVSSPAFAEVYLLMVEEKGCVYCARWNRDIAPIYPKTQEGKTAPLMRFDLQAGQPDIKLDRKVVYTPTFILVQDGQETGRIEGYPGEDFFWGLLTELFDGADIPLTSDTKMDAETS